MVEKRLNEINEERDALWKQLNKLDEEAYRIENADALEVAENAIGKFYWNKRGGVSMTSIFNPKKVSGRADVNITLSGEYVIETVYLIGYTSVYASDNHPVRIDEFKRDFEEISEAEYNEKKKSMFEFFIQEK